MSWVLVSSSTVWAGVLPEDAAEVLYHNYDGGGTTIDGPALLIRKNAGQQVSLSAGYYVDSISSASVDVLATASAYTEERTEFNGGVDYLHDKTLMSLAYTLSDENDFDAQSVHLSVSQDVFGDLTTLTMGYSRGWDTVRTVGNDTFSAEADRQHYRFGVAQVVTRDLLVGLDYETITDEGFLNNPYRQVRYVDAASGARGYSYQAEVYPQTRTSNAVALRASHYLSHRAALRGELRYYTDTWGIRAETLEVAYVHPLKTSGPWVVEARYRFHQQNRADFYSDLFPFRSAQSFLARDKELSTFSSHTVGGGVSYAISAGVVPGVRKAEFSLLVDYLRFAYDDFRDVTQGGGVGEEPLYDFGAVVTRLYMIVNY